MTLDNSTKSIDVRKEIAPGQGARTELRQNSDKVDTKKIIAEQSKISEEIGVSEGKVNEILKNCKFGVPEEIGVSFLTLTLVEFDKPLPPKD